MPLESSSWLDKYLGMRYYITDRGGIGGKVKQDVEDFIVEEVLLDGQVVPTSLTGKPLPRLISKPGPWTWLLIEKKGMDAITLLLMLSRRLGVGLHELSFGGFKDALAVTAQVISVRGISPNNVPSDLSSNVRVLTALSMDRPFTTSDIWGNEFTIRVRRANSNMGLVDCIINQVMERGLPTYYGYQRFGLKRPNSHVVGKYIIRGDFENAVNEIIAHAYPMEPSRIREVREFIARTGDYAKALDLLPKGYKYYPERILLRHLASNPRDYVNALRKLPHELLMIYVEAYQSYLFNLALTERISRGLPINKAVLGDIIILLDEHGLPTKHVIHVNEPMLDKINELIIKGRAVPAGHLIGYNTKPLPGIQGDIEHDVMRMEKVDPSMFRVKAIPKLYIKGSYRPLSVKPIMIKVEVQGNDLTLVFRLPRGNYATTFLREFIKSEKPETAFA
jgi:tRNA pseudouridine13 synthase